jgi:hypothetical protein
MRVWMLWSLQSLPERIRELAQSQGGQAVSDTPISDSTAHNVADLGMLCRRLERELTASNTIIRQQQLLDEENLRLQERIKRLEEAGDLMVQHFYTDEPRSEMWEKAKEAKP